MSSVKDAERAMASALHQVADDVDVTRQDLDRLEHGWRERTARGAHAEGRGPRLALAAVAAAALAIAAVALSHAVDGGRSRSAPAVPSVTSAVSFTPADLVGVWRADLTLQTLWVFRLDGSLETLRRPTDLTADSAPRLGRFTVTGSRLTVEPSDVCHVVMDLARRGPGALLLENPRVPAACEFEFGSYWWVQTKLTRLQPPGSGPVTSNYQTGSPSPVTWMSGLEGTWLHPGSTRVLAITETTPGRGVYVVSDDLAELDPQTGQHVFAQRGTVALDSAGHVSFRASRASCTASYRDVQTDYATLSARLEGSGCEALGGPSDTWIRLN